MQIQAGIFVKQHKTNTPIANAMLLITRGVPPSGFGTTVIDTLYTDGNGKAFYNKKVDENYMYYAEAYKDGYFDTHNQQVDVKPGEKNFTTTIYMYAHSWVKLHVKNVNPYDPFDKINIKSTCGSFNMIGTSIDTSFIWCDECHCKWMGDYYFGASFSVVKNDSLSKFIFDFTPIPHDTIIVEINY
ncbi:MAG: hypothetical protein H0U27_01675 [Nitrosopumilus sp.]|nr:hypothetical protein [Nitrosopumilus sp.]